ncbi:FAD-dependent oxidoreductase [Roseococcus sp. SYP-B2431]|uniref:NAD(P)/FAD-dependent oxidoreductase n=1 Tax=Roseococcus sp. SYP-B2431 TaxID=2496640 RepID=UPI00103DC65F|nr:FAD-dependent oxidoreductase [Roseococcus sp. SYP-B2431]TCH97134.1 FAD-dependent oxidoreductase [Roseococcus sp. SYP-B2431]
MSGFAIDARLPSSPSGGRGRLAILGGGIVGACTALAAQRAGFEVTLVEPAAPGGEQAASYGNGCWLSPSSTVPPALPGLWKKVPKFLSDPLGPLAIRWSYFPKVAPWLVRYLLSGWTEAKVLRTGHALRALVAGAPELHAALAEEAGVGHLVERRGLLYVFPDRAAFEAEALAWRIRAQTGVTWLEIDEDELRQREPDLDRRYKFALLVEEGGHCRDPGAYVAALVALAEAQGMRRVKARATGFRIEAGRLKAVTTDQGEVAADRAVISAGAYSRALAREAGDTLPLETERGYHAVIADPEAGPRTPMMPSDGKMSLTMTEAGLRVAGQVEIAGLEAAPNWRRAEILRDHLLRSFPGLPREIPAERIKVWMGHRPSMPDGLPCIGKSSASGDILHCFGHGHVGLVAAPRSAELAVALLTDAPPPVPPGPYSPRRFA